jgi:predicted transcriptional regulator
VSLKEKLLMLLWGAQSSGWLPTFVEMAGELKCSVGGIQHAAKMLVKDGMVEKPPRMARAWRITARGERYAMLIKGR